MQEIYARRSQITGWNVLAFRRRGDLGLSIEFDGKSVELRRLKFVTVVDGSKIDVRGCDLWTFHDGKIVKKDSYWKIRPVD